ncbi:MAG: RidA family protein [candidate division Zixibacteria bacterium]|nr:RidA family protein [candidate division Zixibacteria bacterium]
MKEIIKTDKAPAAIGPYSQAVRVKADNLIFCSGQIPMDPATGEIVGETIEEQCRQVMKNLEAVLRAAGADFSRVVKATIYLADMKYFAKVNEIYGGYFKTDPPARAAFAVKTLPKEVMVEIEVIAAG